MNVTAVGRGNENKDVAICVSDPSVNGMPEYVSITGGMLAIAWPLVSLSPGSPAES